MADPTGVVINIAIQAAIRLAILALTPKKHTEGPRLDELSLTTSTYGQPVSIGYGTVLLSGNVIWGRDIREEAEVVEIGKGNPFSLGTNTVYKYFATFAVAIVEREVAELVRIYADGKILYAADTEEIPEEMEDISFRFYRGTEEQTADPIIASDYPEGETPGYRGLSYVVFNEMPLENFSNRIPQFQFVVTFEASTGPQRYTPFKPEAYVSGETGNFSVSRQVVYDRDRELVYGVTQDEGSDLDYVNAYDSITGDLVLSTALFEINGRLDDRFYYPGDIRFKGLISGNPERLIGGQGPYLMWVEGGVGMETHVLLDKDTLLPVTASADRGNGIGWLKYEITEDIREPNYTYNGVYYHLDSSGGGAIVPINFGSVVQYYYVGVSGGDTTARLWDPSRDPIYFDDSRRRGSIGMCKLPELGAFILDRETRPEIGGDENHGIRGITIGKQSVGWTDVYMLLAADPSVEARFGILRMRIGKGGIHTFHLMSHDLTPAGSYDTVFSDYVVDSDEHQMVYDEDSDTLGVYVYENAGGAVAGARIFLAFKVNSGTEFDSNTGNLEFQWSRGNLGWATFFPPSDPQTTSSPDGTILIQTDSAPYSYDVVALNTGYVLRELVMQSQQWTDRDGNEATEEPAGVWDGDNSRFMGFSSASSYGWFQVVPPTTRGTEDLQTVVEDICLRSELSASDIDASALSTKQVRGYAVKQDMSFRAALEPLSTAYNFYGVEEDGKLIFRFNDDTTSFTVSEDDLVASNDGKAMFEEVRTQDAELPSALYVTYMSGEDDYLDDKSVQVAKRSINPNKTMNAVGKVRVELPLTLTDEEAAEIAHRILYESWVHQERVSFRLSQEYLAALPNDVMRVTANDRVEDLRLDKVSVSADLMMEVEGMVIDGSIYDINVQPASGTGSPNWGRNDVGDQRLRRATGFLIDAPLLQDALLPSRDGGSLMMFMAAAAPGSRGTFSGAALATSINDAPFEFRSSTFASMAWGIVSSSVPDIPSVDWNSVQEESLDVQVYNGLSQFTSVTQADMIGNDSNSAILYEPSTGKVEYIGFRDAEIISGADANRRRLTGLMRGKRGTNTMASNFTDTVYLVIAESTWISGFIEGLNRLDAEVDYRTVPNGRTVDYSDVKTLTYEHRALMPYAPAHPEIQTSGSDWIVSWTRRTRQGGSWRDFYQTVSLSEDTEAYEVDILDTPGGTVLRTIETGEPSIDYTAAMLAEDQGTGFEGQLHVAIYQISGQVGRGFPRTASFALE